MLIFNTIKAKNLLSIGNAWVELNYKANPTTIITGKNGHGKSVLMLEALFYGLYGKSFRGLTLPAMINSINKKNMVVELEITTNGTDYKIIRGTKPSIFEVYVNGELREPPANLKEYQKWFSNSVLKMDDKTFSQIVILGSAAYKPFLTLGAPDRRVVVEELLDIQIFSDMNTCIKKNISTSKSRMSDVEYDINSTQQLIDAKKQHLADVEKSNDATIAKYKERLAELEAEIDSLQPNIESLQNEISSILIDDAKKESIRKAMRMGTDLIAKHRSKINSTSSTISFYSENDVCPTCDAEIPLELKQDKINECKTAKDKSEEIIAKSEAQLDKLQNELNAISEQQMKVHNLEMELSYLQSKLSTLTKQHANGVKALQDLVDESPDTAPLSEELKLLEEKLTKHKEELVAIKEQNEYNQHIYAMLKDTGVKASIINTYIPVLNKFIAQFLDIMQFNATVVFDCNFKETIKLNNRDEYTYANLSDGQKCRVNLAILFAFREIARLKNSAATSILILDEVGASTLDDEGLDAFMRIIKETSKSSNLFIITHDDKIKDGFTHQVEFELVNKITRIKQ